VEKGNNAAVVDPRGEEVEEREPPSLATKLDIAATKLATACFAELRSE
jgi:hypothetical protein